MAASKNIQISREFFDRLIRAHLFESTDPALEEAICNDLMTKLDTMIRHELYTRYKTAPTPEEAEAARIDYLEHIGLPSSFRW